MRQDARRTARSMCDGEERLVGIETRSARVVFDKFLRELERNATLSNVVDGAQTCPPRKREFDRGRA
jgi:hypothetical protein